MNAGTDVGGEGRGGRASGHPAVRTGHPGAALSAADRERPAADGTGGQCAVFPQRIAGHQPRPPASRRPALVGQQPLLPRQLSAPKPHRRRASPARLQLCQRRANPQGNVQRPHSSTVSPLLRSFYFINFQFF